MKKLSYLLVVIFIVFALTGCSPEQQQARELYNNALASCEQWDYIQAVRYLYTVNKVYGGYKNSAELYEECADKVLYWGTREAAGSIDPSFDLLNYQTAMSLDENLMVRALRESSGAIGVCRLFWTEEGGGL